MCKKYRGEVIMSLMRTWELWERHNVKEMLVWKDSKGNPRTQLDNKTN